MHSVSLHLSPLLCTSFLSLPPPRFSHTLKRIFQIIDWKTTFFCGYHEFSLKSFSECLPGSPALKTLSPSWMHFASALFPSLQLFPVFSPPRSQVALSVLRKAGTLGRNMACRGLLPQTTYYYGNRPDRKSQN